MLTYTRYKSTHTITRNHNTTFIGTIINYDCTESLIFCGIDAGQYPFVYEFMFDYVEAVSNPELILYVIMSGMLC